MEDSNRRLRQSSDPLLRLTGGAAIILTALYGAVILFGRPDLTLPALAWYDPTMGSFQALAASSIAFLAFGRYRVRREPLPFWVGIAFGSHAILSLFFLLTSPGLLPDERGIIAQIPTTPIWIARMLISILVASLSAAVLARWPQAGMAGERLWLWLALVILAAVIALASLIVMFEQYLPPLIVGRKDFSFDNVWRFVTVGAYGTTALLASYRYRQTGDRLYGFVALTSVLAAFTVVTGFASAGRYDLFWYLSFVHQDSGLMAMLFGLLSEYVSLYRRERERTIEVELLRRDAQRWAAQLQAILDNMVDGVLVCDTENRIILANAAEVRLLGARDAGEIKGDLARLLGRARSRHLDGTPVEPQETVLARALMGKTIVQEDGIIYNPKTERDVYVRSSAAPIRDERGKIVGAVAVTKDVTELMELDRLKDQFLSVAAHELKTPVTGIKGYAQLLLRRNHEEMSPLKLKALEAINRQSDRIGRLVNELLETSRIQTGRLELHPTKFDLSELSAETVERMKLATEKHTLFVESPGPVLVNADRERIGEVLSTLLDNAIKFSPRGGDIKTTISITDGEAVVSVQDPGVGIPAGKQDRIFERFYRAHTGTPYDYGGMGVALYIANEIIIRHGGRMWFQSEEGKGSTFSFSLPVA